MCHFVSFPCKDSGSHFWVRFLGPVLGTSSQVLEPSFAGSSYYGRIHRGPFLGPKNGPFLGPSGSYFKAPKTATFSTPQRLPQIHVFWYCCWKKRIGHSIFLSTGLRHDALAGAACFAVLRGACPRSLEAVTSYLGGPC